MKHAVFAACLLLIAAGCAPQPAPIIAPPPKPNGVQFDLTVQQRTQVEAGVKAALKDPMSAMFGDMHGAKAPDGTLTVCGYVNAKNSFGGYTGQKPFAGQFTSAGFVTADVGGDEISITAILNVCRRRGVAI